MVEYMSVIPSKWPRDGVSKDVVVGHRTTNGTIDIDSFNARDYA